MQLHLFAYIGNVALNQKEHGGVLSDSDFSKTHNTLNLWQ